MKHVLGKIGKTRFTNFKFTMLKYYVKMKIKSTMSTYMARLQNIF